MKAQSSVTVFAFLFLCCCSLLLLTSHLHLGGRVPVEGGGGGGVFEEGGREVRWARQARCDGCFNTSFPVLLDQPHLCSPASPSHTVDLVFFIPTTPSASAQRHVIRSTWASVTRNNTSNFRHVFVVGVTSDHIRMRMVAEESFRFRDVVVMGFNDSYHNLTLKTLTALRWVGHNCPHARFFFKVDDDVWVNTDLLLHSLTQQAPSLRAGVGGICPMSHKVIRDTSAKWYASYESYPDDKYPDYCSGTGYGSTLPVANQIVSASRDVPFFHMEDVYVGMCLQRLGYQAVHLRGFYLRPLPSDPCDPSVDSVVTFHPVTPTRMRKQWTADCSLLKAEQLRRKKSLYLDFFFLMQ